MKQIEGEYILTRQSVLLTVYSSLFLKQSSHIDVVRFPCVVYINEVRVIPPGVRAHSNLPDN